MDSNITGLCRAYFETQERLKRKSSSLSYFRTTPRDARILKIEKLQT
jgi:hypothetical protein